MSRINYFEIEELVSNIFNLDEDQEHDIDDVLCERYETSSEQYQQIVEDLFDRLSIGISPLTNKAYIGFSDVKNGIWLVKKEADNQFIPAVISWISESADIPVAPAAFEKDIIVDDVIEYTVTIQKMNSGFPPNEI